MLKKDNIPSSENLKGRKKEGIKILSAMYLMNSLTSQLSFGFYS